MKEKQFFKSLKTKFILVLALMLVVCSALFGFVACSDDDSGSTYEEPTYSYTQDEEKNEVILNKNFDKDSQKISADQFPYSASNWTKGVDNSAKTSEINSGVIGITEKNWDALIEKLLKDNDFVKYLENNGKSKETVDELFVNPGKAGSDDYVYMLNNYLASKNDELGTAQKITSASKITLEKGKIAKISVAVKTANIVGYNDGQGANIRLVNTVANNTQAEFQVSNIISNDAWTTYELYVKADANYESTITLVLGLGFGSGSNNYQHTTEGTAYFDNVNYEVLDDYDVSTIAKSGALNYSSKDAIKLNAESDTKFFYDMSVVGNASLVYTPVNFATDNAHLRLTTSNIAGVEPKGEVDFTNSTAQVIKATLNKSSASIKIDNNGVDFELEHGKFTLISFDILNGLSKFGSTDITVDLYERNDTTYVKRAAIASFSTVSEDVSNCKLLIKNNFESGTRQYYLDVVVGPTNISNDINSFDYASGNVEISNLKTMTETVRDDDADDYSLFNLYTSSPSATINLYAGYMADFKDEETESNPNYNLQITPGSVGEIASYPVSVKGYSGITTDSAYISGSSDATAVINERVGGGVNGSYAGLINTKYLTSYTGFGTENELKTALSLETLELEDGKYLQPLMIYNNTADHYGFVGDTISVSSNDYASVIVRVRVDGDAKAFIYLVDTSKAEKDVLTFDGLETNNEYKFVITNDDMAKDGWLDVKFYIATGATAKNFRVEVWNGGRTTNEDASSGYVFINSISTSKASAFTEPSRYEDAFTSTSSPLGSISKDDIIEYKLHTRELSELEEQFNEDYPDEKVEYRQNYIWLTTKSMIYSSFNTIDPAVNDPYADKDTTTDSDSGCSAESDPATFWLSFSSILLGVVLIAAIIALIAKKAILKYKANKSDAKVHYNVSSRAKALKDVERKKRIAVNKEEDDEEVEQVEETEKIEQETLVEDETTNEQPNETLDDYVYGDVQDFGDDIVAEPTNDEDNE